MSEPKHIERQATEDLLSGFDRPGRSPRTPRSSPIRHDFNTALPTANTVLVTRRRSRSLWPWLAAAFLLSGALGVAGWLLVMPSSSPPSPGVPASPVKEATTAVFESTRSMAPPPPAASSVAPSRPPPKPAEPHRSDFMQGL